MPRRSSRLAQSASSSSSNEALETKLRADLAANAAAQDNCPLFHLPPEVRNKIYGLVSEEERVPDGEYAKGITEEDFLDSLSTINQDGDSDLARYGSVPLPNWSRPDCTGRMRMPTNILGTCKLMYKEAASIPIAAKVHRCYQSYGPKRSPTVYFEQFTDSQLDQIRKLHLFTHPGEFDADGLWLRRALRPVSENLQHLTITLRHLSRAPDRPLLLNPFRLESATRAGIKEDMAKGASELTMPESGWGGSFREFPALQTLTIELEDEIMSREMQLQEIVYWAKTWVFPLSEGGSLTSTSIPRFRTWRRPITHHHRYRHPNPDDSPRIITWAIRWDASRKSPRDSQARDAQAKRSVRTRSYQEDAQDTPRVERPAYDPCLGGLNSIYAHASDEAIQSMIDYGIL